MKIRFNEEIEDLVTYLQLPILISPAMRKMYYKLYYKRMIVRLVGYLCLYSAISLIMGRHYSDVIIVCVVACVVSCVVVWPVRLFCNRFFPNWKFSQKLIQREVSKSKYAGMLCGQYDIELVPDGIRETTPNGAISFTKFTQINCIEVTSTHVYIYIYSAADDLNAYVIPKAKVFEGDLDAFIADLKDNIQSSRNNQ